MANKKKVQVYAVIRVDSGMADAENAISVVKVLSTLQDVEKEVLRLNRLNAGKGTRYFWQATRFYSQA